MTAVTPPPDAASVDAAGTPWLAVPPERWHEALAELRADGYVWFDHLTAVDDGADGSVAVLVHVATSDLAHRVMVSTQVPRDGGSLPTVTDIWAGADWSEREAHELVGVGFDGHPGLRPLLLAAGGSAHPLRRDVPLERRQVTPWPGEKDPSDRRVGLEAAPGRAVARRRPSPPGVVPDTREQR